MERNFQLQNNGLSITTSVEQQRKTLDLLCKEGDLLKTRQDIYQIFCFRDADSLWRALKAKYKIQNAKYKVQNTKHKIHDAKYKIQNVQNIKYKPKYSQPSPAFLVFIFEEKNPGHQEAQCQYERIRCHKICNKITSGVITAVICI